MRPSPVKNFTISVHLIPFFGYTIHLTITILPKIVFIELKNYQHLEIFVEKFPYTIHSMILILLKITCLEIITDLLHFLLNFLHTQSVQQFVSCRK